MAKMIVTKMSIGAVIVLFGILMLHKGVTVMELDFEFISDSLGEWAEFTPYLLVGFVSCFLGFMLFFSALVKVGHENL